MNQEKIGKFIAQCRKKKNMTQQELGELLGVSDRTIGNWENGRNMPDMSLFKPLCDELGISINDLISGEKVKENEYQEKLEENIISTIDYTNNKIKGVFRFSIGFIFLIFITLVTLFVIDINRIKNNEPVLFSTWGFDYAPTIDLHEEKIKIAIKDYLIEKSDNDTHHENEKGFASFRTYLIEEKERDLLYNIYAWVLEEKYYLKNDEIKKDSGSSIPYKLVVEFIDGEYVVTDSRIPRDGSLYTEDMKNIFPRSVRNDMNDIYMDGTIERLEMDIQEQIKLYFHK